MSEMTFHEKAGRSQEDSSWFSLVTVFSPAESPPLSPPFHPHSLMSAVRPVQVGCSRFSRCCHLIVDLYFHLHDGSWARPLTQSPELGVWILIFPS
jgi:hypothetical protein